MRCFAVNETLLQQDSREAQIAILQFEWQNEKMGEVECREVSARPGQSGRMKANQNVVANWRCSSRTILLITTAHFRFHAMRELLDFVGLLDDVQ